MLMYMHVSVIEVCICIHVHVCVHVCEYVHVCVFQGWGKDATKRQVVSQKFLNP